MSAVKREFFRDATGSGTTDKWCLVFDTEAGIYVEHAIVCVLGTAGSYRARRMDVSTCLADRVRSRPSRELWQLLTAV
jgi:hypothetical protein